MTRAGTLRHRIIIQQPGSGGTTEGQDDFGDIDPQWETFATRWASVEPLHGREQFEAQQFQATVTHRIRLRYLAGVEPKMRVKFGTRLFNIQTVMNIAERNRDLELLCEEVI